MPRSFFTSLAFATVLLMVSATASVAFITVPHEPVPNKVALADCVIVGKITSLGNKPARTRVYPHLEAEFELTVAEVEVSEGLVGAEKGKSIKLAFLDIQLKSGQFKPAPEVGQEGCFFAVKVPTANLYLVPAGGFLETKGEAFKKDVALARRCTQLLGRPDEGLKSKVASDRVLTAYLLAMKDTYRPQRYFGSSAKAEPMDAERSKLIMLALSEADWTQKDPETGASPATALQWLRHAKSDWPKTFPQGAEGAKRWLKDNADSYRLRRLVGPAPTRDKEARPPRCKD